ncbi:[FeFe] hydrogenase H-cluster radical SAM maturase HydG [Gracilinema caldarium]|uniref:Biotin and thiamin synthesis associated n=1 Tax=Gracilinema caldarium (strain ATCC 51460 / DSM 7334 / H1) TaxID=744872 RepID=F8F3Z1_GRAC1|nr:[FeFe] hydrogenase H-cluster radical SAM maturase HydG [Gracilinema caldarium]AEJ20010.1 biotin and thiamin synthesis associated [Gracilinema caldarium DSM 7334]
MKTLNHLDEPVAAAASHTGADRASSVHPSTFLDYNKLSELSRLPAPTPDRVDAILAKARTLQGLTAEEAAELAAISDPDQMQALLATAGWVKEQIYGKRMVLFAPLYTGNYCVNNCVYCGFRVDNRDMKRVVLSMDEIAHQTEILLSQGHKRLLIICGESPKQSLDYTLKAIETVYAVRVGTARVRRINVELAPLDVEGFRALKQAQIGTYVCFQETYDPELYRRAHPSGPKADYLYRLYVMDRAMEGGCDDIGLGALFGLGSWRYELVALLEHARHLEETFGWGPHTVSVPRIEYAPGAPWAEVVPNPVSDDDFRKIVAILRIARPSVGIILSTRERTEFRKELLAYGVSQISAGSRTDPGGYEDEQNAQKGSAEEHQHPAQFAIGDLRGLEETISDLIDDGYVPSFCTGCYRKGRTGADFMDLAKPGLIKEFCLPNGLVSFAEYLYDYASPATREKGLALIERMKEEATTKGKVYLEKALKETEAGARDLYL